MVRLHRRGPDPLDFRQPRSQPASERWNEHVMLHALVDRRDGSRDVGGRLPRGFCVKRLTDLPMLWSEQWRALGLQAPIQLQAEPS